MAIPVTTIQKYTGEFRAFCFDFSNAPEVVAGETLSSPTVTVSPSGPTIGSPSVLSSAFDDVASGKGIKVTVSGGTAGTTYTLTCTVTTSGGATLICKGLLPVE